MSWVKEADLPDLPEIFRAISSNGQALELVEQLNEGIAFGSSALTRAQEEAIATAVSVANRCRYGALTHGGFFRKHAGSPDTASQMLADYTQADLSPEDRVMLDFSVKVTIDPAGLTEEDLERLREAGFPDDQIVSIVLVTCLFNFMNRIANSLGVEVPAPFVRSVEQWLTGPAAQESWLLGSDVGQHPGDLSWRGLGKALDRLPVPSPPQAEELVAADASSSDQPQVEIASDEGLPQDAPKAEKSPKDSKKKSKGTVADASPKANSQLRQFVSECCTVGEGETCTARDLYVAYLRWCDLNRNSPVLQRIFGLALSKMGFQRRRRSHGQHWWLGLGINAGETGR